MTDPIAALARWLAEHVEWLRHREFVDEVYRDFAECASKLRHVVDGPAAKKYLGPCGTEIRMSNVEDNCPANCACHNGPYYSCDEPGGCGSAGCGRPPVVAQEPCEGDVYGRVGAQHGTCRTCGAQVDQDERRAWLDSEVRQYAYTAAEIAAAYPIKRNTINVWASRNRLIAHDTDSNGRPRYNLGDVLDLAAGDAARRETDRATRERRAAAKAEDGRVSA